MTRSRDRGSISVWMATAALCMTLLVGLAVDLGGQVHAQQRAHDLAAQAARAGGERVQAAPAVTGEYVRIDAIAARNAAQAYLANADVSGSVSVVDGTTLSVHVRDTYEPRFLTVLGIGPLPVHGNATARLVRNLGGTER